MISVKLLQDESDVNPGAFDRLLKQLRGADHPLESGDWRQLLLQENVHVWIALADSDPPALVGALTLVTARIPTKPKAWIEDVVVDVAWRRKGIARMLMNTASEFASQTGCRIVELTSRPDRTEGNSLYRSLGYELRHTNVYRLRLSRDEPD